MCRCILVYHRFIALFFFLPTINSPCQLNLCPQMKASQPNCRWRSTYGERAAAATERGCSKNKCPSYAASFLNREVSRPFWEKVSQHLPRHLRCFASVFQGCTWNCHAKNFTRLKWDRCDACRSEHVKRPGALSLLHPPTCFHSTLYCPRALSVQTHVGVGEGARHQETAASLRRLVSLIVPRKND